MSSKTKNKKSSSDKFSLDARKNQPFKKKIISPQAIIYNQKSKVSSKRQKSHVSNIKMTPSFVSGKSAIPIGQQNLIAQYSLPSLRQNKPSLLAAPGSSRLARKNLPQNLYNLTGSDYQEFQTQKFKSEMKWTNKNNRGSTVNNQICHEYGYSNLSNPKSNLSKPLSSLSKKKRKVSEKQEIQRLLVKYTKHLDIPLVQNASTSKNKNFRTLSTDDKSQKKLQFTKRAKNRRKNVPTSKNLITVVSPQQKCISANKNKSLKTRRTKKSSKTLLPDYFGCLSINKVESKIQTMKDKQEKTSIKKVKQPATKNQRTDTHRKSQQNMQTTKVKQQRTTTKEVRQFCNKDTKKCPVARPLNSQRSTVSPFKRKSEDSTKIRGEKRSRRVSRKEIRGS